MQFYSIEENEIGGVIYMSSRWFFFPDKGRTRDEMMNHQQDTDESYRDWWDRPPGWKIADEWIQGFPWVGLILSLVLLAIPAPVIYEAAAGRLRWYWGFLAIAIAIALLIGAFICARYLWREWRAEKPFRILARFEEKNDYAGAIEYLRAESTDHKQLQAA